MQNNTDNKRIVSDRGNITLVLLFSLCIVVVTASYVFVNYVDARVFPIEEIDVKNAFVNVSSEKFKAAVSGCIEYGYFGIEVECIEKSLQSIDWVKSVSVRKIWPNRIYIDIDEHKPVALWGGGKELSSSGRIVAVKGDRGADLPTFVGARRFARSMIRDYAVLHETIGKLGRKIKIMQTDDRGATKLVLDNGTEMYFGGFDIKTKAAQIEKTFPKLFTGKMDSIKRVDFRYQNGFAVRWANVKGKTFSGNEYGKTAKGSRFNG